MEQKHASLAIGMSGKAKQTPLARRYSESRWQKRFKREKKVVAHKCKWVHLRDWSEELDCPPAPDPWGWVAITCDPIQDRPPERTRHDPEPNDTELPARGWLHTEEALAAVPTIL